MAESDRPSLAKSTHFQPIRPRPKIATRISSYEMAYRMQASAPEPMDLAAESQDTLDSYGVDPAKPSFAKNCLLARRLVERSMLDETLVIWGGEFGRTPLVQGGGMKPGTTLGKSDDFGFNVTEDAVHARDLHATTLNRLGFDHT